MSEAGRVWAQVENLLRPAEQRVVLVAPFIKLDVFEAAVRTVPRTVTDITCVTRWSVAEVAAGVSDTEILEAAQRDGRVAVLLCHTLHAKLFLADDRCLVGSANLTGRATGRVPQPNLEILVNVAASHPEVRHLLDRIQAMAIPATANIAASIREQADLLRKDRPMIVTGEADELPTRWYPTTRRPDRLYTAYRGRGDFSAAVREGIVYDLAHLDVAPGLDEPSFNEAVRLRLRSIQEIPGLLKDGILNSLELQEVIADHTGMDNREAQRATETIAAWLRYFDRFYTNVASWELRPGRELRQP
ncbi:phospholipase D family protein [Dactylosporangium sp. NPDC005572]|uniref:phospholipase D family protein n=1 Tax=Dactylosporangium sp. NPDC005572 TaxID=3156889 RepID=UPI0033B3DE13